MTEDVRGDRRAYWTAGNRIDITPIVSHDPGEIGDVLFRGDTGVTIRLDNGKVRFYPWSAILYVEVLE